MSDSNIKNQALKNEVIHCKTPQQTFDFGEKLGASLHGGEIILLRGGLGAGKTLLTKGILYGLDYDVDEVNSPSFTLVNLYKTSKFNVYHLDLWRLNEGTDIGRAVGLDELIEEENSVVIIEWSERLGEQMFSRRTYSIEIRGDGDDAREIFFKKRFE